MSARSVTLGVFVILLAATAALLSISGANVSGAVAALIRGSVGSWYAFGSGTLVRATPLILTGLGVAIAFRAGVFNIGAEGQFLAGATSAAAVALGLPHAPSIALVPAVLVAGAVSGAAWAWIASVLRVRFHVLEVISTIMLNFVAAYAVSYLVRGPLQEPTRVYPQTETIAAAAQLPRLGSATRLHVGFAIAIATCLVTWWLIRYTAGGFRLRAVGANSDAARSAGQIDVVAVARTAFLASGALAGLAGAIEVSGVTYALYENISPGYGYTAIAVALLGRLDAIGVLITGILFGALDAGANAMQRDANVPAVVVTVVEAIAVLGFVAVGRVRFGRGEGRW